jgi:hypothetical protein
MAKKYPPLQKQIIALSVTLLLIFNTHGIQFIQDHSWLIALTIEQIKRNREKRFFENLLGMIWNNSRQVLLSK